MLLELFYNKRIIEAVAHQKEAIMSTMEADGFMYGVGIFPDEESDSQSETTAMSSVSIVSVSKTNIFCDLLTFFTVLPF